MIATFPTDAGLKVAPTLFTDETAAAHIGDVEPRTIRDWRMRRGLPFIRITPKVIRIRKEDLDKWLSRHAVSITRGVA